MTKREKHKQPQPRSNTGVIGVSEMVVYIRPRHHKREATRHTIFAVNWRENGRRRYKRFFYRDHIPGSRKAALAEAVAHRKKMIKENL